MARRNVFAIAIVLISALATSAAEMRTWTSGKFKIEGKFVAVKDGKVTLEKADGSKVEVDLKKLSAADQKYVADQQAEEDNPFKSKDAKDSNSEPAPAGDPNKSIDWSNSRTVDPAPAESTWKLSVKAGDKSSAGKTVMLPATTDFFEKLNGLAMNTNATFAVVSYTLQKPGTKDTKTRLLLCDLTKGKVVANGGLPGAFAPLAISDDGTRVVLRKDEFGHGAHDRLEVLTFEGANLKPVARFTPYDDYKNLERDIIWGAFAESNRLLTVSGGGKLACWDLQAFKPEYHLMMHAGSRPGLSPDRTLLAFHNGQEVGVLDIAAGKVLATQPMEKKNWAALAFSPSGKRLACVAFDFVQVWDSATGAQQAEMTLHQAANTGDINWTNDEDLLVGHGTLIDPDKQVQVWTYSGADALASAGGTLWTAVAEGNRGPGALAVLKLPHPAAKAALEKAMSDLDFVILKGGFTVALDVAGIDIDQQEKVRANLTQKLQANGCKVGAGNITLVASTEAGKERDVTYHTFGRIHGDKTYKVQEHFAKLKFVWQDKDAWQSSSLNIPFFVHLKEGETMEGYLKEHEKPNYKFFETVELPKVLTKPTGMPALGQSRVTPAGIKDFPQKQ
ncbi:MAG: SHD1 domain-containing protein [Gemmataceae bacterium]